MLHYFTYLPFAVLFLSIPVAPDAPPRDFSVTDRGSTHVRFSWDPPPTEFQNGAIISYTLSCKPSTSLLTLNYTYQNESFTPSGGVETNITGLSPGTMYMCTVLATNGAGDSPKASVNVTTVEERKQSARAILNSNFCKLGGQVIRFYHLWEQNVCGKLCTVLQEILAVGGFKGPWT